MRYNVGLVTAQLAGWGAFALRLPPHPIDWPAMSEWLQDELAHFGWTWSAGMWGLASALLMLFLGNLAVVVVLVKLPATYFSGPARKPLLAARHPLLRSTLHIAKNLLGSVTVLAGLVLSLPGIPGPGLLLILIGIMLLEFPGKRKLECRIVARPKVYGTINWLRRRFGQPPLVLDVDCDPV